MLVVCVWLVGAGVCLDFSGCGFSWLVFGWFVAAGVFALCCFVLGR